MGAGAKRQEAYRKRLKAKKAYNLNIFLEAETADHLKTLAAQRGLSVRDTVDAVIGEAYTLSLSNPKDKSRDVPCRSLSNENEVKLAAIVEAIQRQQDDIFMF